MSARSGRRRTALAVLVLLAVVGVFLVRLVDIQVLHAEELSADSLQHRSRTASVYARRGDIVDASGVVLAHTVRRYDLTVSPRHVGTFRRDTASGDSESVTPEQAAAEIGAITGQTGSEIMARIEEALADDPGSAWARIASGLDLTAYEAINELDIPWQYWEERDRRLYPNGAVAGNVIGFSGADGEPLEGIELSEDACLRAENGSESYETGGDLTRIPGTTTLHKPVKEGGQLQLTIDADLNWFAQQSVAEQVQTVGGTFGQVTVMEVATGKIRALAQYPSVDPNNIDATPVQFRTALGFTTPFEPGSTFKAVTAASLLDAGVADAQSPVLAEYRYNAPNGADINDTDFHLPERYTLTGVLTDSSNTGISQLGERLPEAERYKYIERFGAGRETEVHFGGESAGILHDLPWDNQTTYATMFGQGLSISAVQVASIFQTLGNHGVRVPVQLVEGCVTGDGRASRSPSTKGRRVVSAEAADTTVRMLESVVNRGWLSDTLRIPGYRVAAKTGTAQQADGNGGYSHSYLVSMSGLAPAEDPRFVVSVHIADPVTLTSSEAAAPVFHEVMARVLTANRIPESTEAPADLPTHY